MKQKWNETIFERGQWIRDGDGDVLRVNGYLTLLVSFLLIKITLKAVTQYTVGVTMLLKCMQVILYL